MNGDSVKIAVLGKGELAINVAEWFLSDYRYFGDEVTIVPVIPEPQWGPRLTRWATQRIPRMNFVASGNYRELIGTPIDIAISVFYEKIIKQDFIQSCNRILNIHNSPLPKYRGMNPINWALKNGEREHGVTIHEIDEGVDTGPIVSQLKYSIYPEFEEVWDVYWRSLKYAYALFQQTMPMLEKIKPVPQDSSKATYYCREDAVKLGNRRNWTRVTSKEVVKENHG